MRDPFLAAPPVPRSRRALACATPAPRVGAERGRDPLRICNSDIFRMGGREGGREASGMAGRPLPPSLPALRPVLLRGDQWVIYLGHLSPLGASRRTDAVPKPFPLSCYFFRGRRRRNETHSVATLINCPHSKWRDERKKKKASEGEVEARTTTTKSSLIPANPQGVLASLEVF